MKVHAPSPRHATWPWCGQAGDAIISTEPAEVDCSKCQIKLGVTVAPRWCTAAELELIAAARQWRSDFMANNENEAGSWPRDDALCKAVDAYDADIAGRRTYSG